MMKKKSQTIWEMAVENASVKDLPKTQPKVETPEKIHFGRELFLLFSNKAGLLSSKKIERMIIFISLLTITIILLAKRIDEISIFEFLQIIGLWLSYGGWSSYMTFRDKKLSQETTAENTSEPAVETPADYPVEEPSK